MQGSQGGKCAKGTQIGSHFGTMWPWLPCPPFPSQNGVHTVPKEASGSKTCMLSRQLQILTPTPAQSLLQDFRVDH